MSITSNAAYPWSILGIDDFQSSRRLRNLGLLPVIKQFNDLAVPQMGGVSFAKQIYLACLGIAVNQKLQESLRLSNIQVTNAVEALACKLALEQNYTGPRVKGSIKLKDWKYLAFNLVKGPGGYVTQPFRMSTVQCLPGLGLTNAANRFNEFELTDAGNSLIETYDPFGTEIITSLCKWITRGESQIVRSNAIKVIQPNTPLNARQRALLRNCICRNEERKAVWEWAASGSHARSWQQAPRSVSQEHWKNLHAGADFTAIRKRAIALLDKIEHTLHQSSKSRLKLSDAVNTFQKDIKAVSQACDKFLKTHDDPTEGAEAKAFCEESASATELLKNLISRDGLFLRIDDNLIVPGPAFDGGAFKTATEDEAGANDLDDSVYSLPINISFRVHHMFTLQNDLK